MNYYSTLTKDYIDSTFPYIPDLTKPVGFIYKYTNLENNKCYIGKTTRIRHRMYYHQYYTKQQDSIFGRALRKYGYNSFKFEILLIIRNISDKEILNKILNNLEIFYINKFNSYRTGYNTTKGGDGTLGQKRSLESRRKQGETLKRNMTPERLEVLQKQMKNLHKKYNLGFPKTNPQNKRFHKRVEQYTLDGQYIREFYSIKDAARFLGNVRYDTTIINACKGRFKQAYGYIWKYKQ